MCPARCRAGGSASAFHWRAVDVLGEEDPDLVLMDTTKTMRERTTLDMPPVAEPLTMGSAVATPLMAGLRAAGGDTPEGLVVVPLGATGVGVKRSTGHGPRHPSQSGR